MWKKWLASLLGGDGGTTRPALHPLRGADGRIMSVADQLTNDYLASQAPNPSQAALDALLVTITRVRIIEDGVAHGKALGEKLLLDETDRQAIAALRDCLEIDETAAGFHCMCLGDYAIELYVGDERAATIGLHHGRSIRWDTTWKHDALLSDGRKLLGWMSTRGLTAPLAMFEAERARAEAAKQAAERWCAAMPPCLLPFWEQMRRDDVAPGTLHLALIAAIPDPFARIQTLVGWYGSGAGHWSGYPHYEQAAEELLLLEETTAIVGVLAAGPLTPLQIAGAARYFASWHLRKHKPHDMRLVPEQLKAQFLGHGLTSASADIRERALRAFDVERAE